MEDITIPRYAIQDAMSNASIWDGDIRPDYSGRFMYGKTCLGVVMERGSKDRFLKELRELLANDSEITDEDEEEMEEEEYEELQEARRQASIVVNKARTDDMGRDMIVYFPGVQLED